MSELCVHVLFFVLFQIAALGLCCSTTGQYSAGVDLLAYVTLQLAFTHVGVDLLAYVTVQLAFTHVVPA